MAFPGEQTTSSCLSWALKHLERELSYAAKVGESVADLAQAMTRLDARSKDVAKKLAAARRVDATQQGTSEVEEWLRSVEEIETKVNSIKADYEQRCRCFSGCSCSANICSNWNIGRKATKKLVTVNDLYQRGGDFIGEAISVARPGSPPPGQQMPGTSNLLAVDSNLQQVLGYLREDGVRTVGISGMGGVGKTTLLKAINNKLSSGRGNDMRFDHVIWVVVSRHAQIQKVQADIAECLKLPLPNDASFKARHDAIFNFLNNKKFIILLDDVWERLDLDEMGVPDHRVVLFTTRSELVCGIMEAHRKFKVNYLNKDDAWRLFTSKVGEEIISSKPEIEKLAKKVAEKCEGLPLALIVLGRAMSSKHTLGEWQHTLTTLKKSQPGASKIQEPVFHILKYSYYSLTNETTRKCFLFCALYPEDYSFGIDELINYLWGHGLIDVEGCKNVGEIYDRGYDEVIGVLKSACLLEANDTGERVKMHDVIRDMALWIASDCGVNNTNWVVRAYLKSEQALEGVSDWEMAERLSLLHNRIIGVPMPKTICEKLTTLILQSNLNLKWIPNGCFKCFPALSYLDLSRTRITQLPEEVSSLIELQFIDLSDTDIKSLSVSLGNLKKLKHLRCVRCYSLDYIPYGLISCLPMLQHLDLYDGAYIFHSENFIEDNEDRDESEGVEDFTSGETTHKKANLDELKILKEHQRIKSISLNLKMETILDLRNVVNVASVRRLKLFALQDSKPQDFIENLTKVAHSIEKLEMNNFGRLEELILTTEQIRHDENWCFHRLSFLVLHHLNGLRKITWTKLMLIEMFPSLKHVSIRSCHGLQNLTWIGHLPCLEYLDVLNCNGLEEIIGVDENGEGSSKTPSSIFPKLSNLHLLDLENFSISKGILDSPMLEELSIFNCPELKRLSFSFQTQITNKSDVHITCDLEWWEGLEWIDDTIKSYLQPFVQVN